jgi:predicted permease
MLSAAVLLKLAAMSAIVGLGWTAGRLRWLGGGDAARVLGNAAFYVFVPALLVRTTARIDLAALPWATLAAFFGPALALLVGTYLVSGSAATRAGAAAPSVRALGVTFGNTIQLGIPVATALFGEAGLSVHLAIVALHALTLLSVATVLVELDLARAQEGADGARRSLSATLAATVRATVIHPVVLPVLAGLAINLAGLALPALVDETLKLLALAVVPLCLVAIGMSLAQYGLQGRLRAALGMSAAKLFLLPALVLAAGRWGLGLEGVPLAAIVLCAALPVGANPLIFAQRYATLEAETTAAIVVSTLAFALTAPMWLWAVARLG